MSTCYAQCNYLRDDQPIFSVGHECTTKSSSNKNKNIYTNVFDHIHLHYCMEIICLARAIIAAAYSQRTTLVSILGEAVDRPQILALGVSQLSGRDIV